MSDRDSQQTVERRRREGASLYQGVGEPVGVQEEEDPEAAQEDPRAGEVAGGDCD